MNSTRTTVTLGGLVFLFAVLAASFWGEGGGRAPQLAPIPSLDPAFTNTATVRVSAAELARTGGDTSGLECYVCHDRKQPVRIRFDTNQNPILPKEHEDIVMGHGRHNRNNHCFNCHDETNLELLQTRDGRELKLVESTPLCGSCHGPTYRDWEAGVHGRTSGYWDRRAGPARRADCVSCHNPHAPAFPSRPPAPGPHPLHADAAADAAAQMRSH
jgi:cytochrome c7-like protein